MLNREYGLHLIGFPQHVTNVSPRRFSSEWVGINSNKLNYRGFRFGLFHQIHRVCDFGDNPLGLLAELPFGIGVFPWLSALPLYVAGCDRAAACN